MTKEKVGLAVFAGLIGITGLLSSGKVIDINPLLERWNRGAVERNVDAPMNASEVKVEEVVKPAESAAIETLEPSKVIEPAMPIAETDQAAVDIDDQKNTDENQSKQVNEEPKLEVETAKPTDTPTVETDVGNTEAEAPKPAEQQASAQPIMPTFDILRVEPDGSTLIAGVASPLADVEIVAGSKILAKTKANQRGEFVAVFDEPLAVGDYQIVVRATSPDGVVVTSTETAIVSIPETGSKDILALVEAPGVPSRLITLPKAELELVQVVPEPVVPEPVVPEPVVKEPEATVQTATEEEAKPVEEEVATTSEAVAEKVAKPQPSVVTLRIEAVEIDGPTIFVAGGAEVGARIRVYANDILLGESKSNAEGRFLVEVNRDLPVGDYVIRADSIGADGVEVIARVAVPFTRGEGEKLAAIAVPTATTLPSEPPKIPKPDNKNGVVQNDTVEEAQTPKDVKPAENDLATVVNTDVDAPEGSAEIGTRLEPVSSSVIIRRGDTLWQISRRVYGRGVKFTTIYTANQAQIEDPDRIWPGQVFTLPEDSASE